MASGEQGEIRVERTAVEEMRPPWLRLVCKVSLHNPAPHPAWFVLPSFVEPLAEAPRKVYAASAYALPGAGRAVIVVFQGSGACQAVPVAAGGRVRISGVTFDLRDPESAGRATVEVLRAGALAVAGQPLADWLGAPLAGPAAAEAAYDLAHAELLAARRNDDLTEVPLTFSGAQRTAIDLDLGR